jgi:tyrosyl-tRNA synthetase
MRASEIMFGGRVEGVSETVFEDVVGEVPTHALPREHLAGIGMPLIDAVVAAGLASSKGAARRDIEGGGLYVNNIKQGDISRNLGIADALFGRYLLLRKGKRSYAVLRIVD